MSGAAGPLSPLDVPFVPSGPGSGTGATAFGCPLCGLRFTHGVQVCAACPLHAGCELVRCPHCGYQFPRTSKVVGWVQWLVRRIRSRS